MPDDDLALINTPNLMMLILHETQSGPATVEGCVAHLDRLAEKTGETLPLDRPEIEARIAGHMRYLSAARLIEQHTDGWRLTDRGREALTRHPKGFDLSDMMEYPEFADYMLARKHHAAGMDARAGSYDQGYAAGLEGQPMAANPYTETTVDHQSWENGWMQALEDRQ